MKTLIIYLSSYHKNTEKIAKVFSDKMNADRFNLKDAPALEMDTYDLIGFGSGVYYEKMSPKLLNYVEKLNLTGKDVFVFSTSGAGMKLYNHKLIHVLKAKGARCRGSFACKGSCVTKDFSENGMFEIFAKFAEGHPNEKDCCRAEKFMEKVVKKCKA